MGRVAAILCDPVSGLTPKEQAFTEALIETGSPTAAMKKVYHPSSPYIPQMARAVMIRPDVQAEIERKLRVEDATPDYSVKNLMYSIERGKQTDKLSDVIQGAIWIGKRFGLFKEESRDINVNVLQLSINAQPASALSESKSKLELINKLASESTKT